MKIIRLTPPGRGAVASFLLCGEYAVDVFTRHWHGTRPDRSPRWGCLQLNDTGDCEEAVVYCSDDGIEIHTHGGEQVAAAIESLFARHGAERDTWQKHFANTGSHRDLALQRLPFAPTQRTAQILLDQYNGAYEREHLLIEQITDTEEKRRHLARLDELAPLWKHLTEPFRVVLAGAANAGKSSLLNAILGFQRSIVHHQPGTTRDVLTGQTALAGFPVMFFDTAGFRRTGSEIGNDLERQGINRSLQSLADADLAIWVIDVMAEELPCPMQENVLICYNKIDLLALSERPSAIGVSALTGEGLEPLLEEVFRRLVPHPPVPGEAIPSSLATRRAP